MAGQEGLGRLFNVVPIAAGIGISLKDAAGVTFVVTGADTFTVTVADTFGGSYATPGAIIARKSTSTATNGSAAWVDTTQTAANTVVVASGTAVFYVPATALPDTKVYVKCSAGGSGLVKAIVHDLAVQRTPSNLPALGA